MSIAADLQALLGVGAVLTAPLDRAPYERDWRGLVSHPSLAVVLPHSPQQVADIVKCCAAQGVKIVPHGGNTGLVAGAVPVADQPQIILSLARLRQVREVDPLSDTITVEAGLTLLEVQQAALEAGRFFPVSLGAQGTAQIGGVISTNAGGLQVLSYGTTRVQVLGLEVVLADGTIWHGLSHLRKDNTGYDLKQLFIGAEGTLGVVTAATLRLYPPIAARASALIGIKTLAQGLEIFTSLRQAAGTALTLCEYCTHPAMMLGVTHTPQGRLPFDAPSYLLVEISALTGGGNPQDLLEAVLMPALDSGQALDAAVAQSERERLLFLTMREAIPEGEQREGGAVKHDVSVPVVRLPETVTAITSLIATKYPGFRLNIYGHVGDGNLHINVRPPQGQSMADIGNQKIAITQDVEDLALSMQGSFSAEHGIGQMRLGSMAAHKSATDLRLMSTIRQALDPQGLFNPGKTIPEA